MGLRRDEPGAGVLEECLGHVEGLDGDGALPVEGGLRGTSCHQVHSMATKLLWQRFAVVLGAAASVVAEDKGHAPGVEGLQDSDQPVARQSAMVTTIRTLRE